MRRVNKFLVYCVFPILLVLLCTIFLLPTISEAQLAVIKTQTPDNCSVELGTNNFMIDYEIMVNNIGTDAGFQFIDTLPNLQGQSTTRVSENNPSNCDFIATANQYNCNIFLQGGETFNLEYTVMITPESVGEIFNQAGAIVGAPPECSIGNQACINDQDCDNTCLLDNNEERCSLTGELCGGELPACPNQGTCEGIAVVFPSNEVTCDVFSETDVEIVKSSPTNPPGTCITPGEDENVTFTIDITNTGSASASDVTLEDQLPAGFNLVSVSPSSECFEDGMTENLVICDFNEISGMGGSAQVDIMTTINANPNPENTMTAPNSATITFFDEGTGDDATDSSNSLSICIERDCNPSFDGNFAGITTFERDDPAFSQDANAQDATTLDNSNVNTETFDSVIDADWIRDVTLNIDCIGNIANFDGQFTDVCGETGNISGQFRILQENGLENEIAIQNGVGNDCKGGYTFSTLPGQPLVREGTTGNTSTQDSGFGNAQGGCALSENGNDGSGYSIFIAIMLIPGLILLRMSKNKLSSAVKSLIQKSGLLSFVLIVFLSVVGILLFTTTSSNAQTILKNCEDAGVNRSTSESLDLLCSQLKNNESELNSEQLGLLATCEEIVNGDLDACEDIAQSLTETSLILTELLSVQSQNQFKNIRSRLASLRAGGGSTISLGGEALRNFDTESPLYASTMDPVMMSQLSLFNQAPSEGVSAFSRFGVFLNGSFNFGDRDQSRNSNGYDFDIFEIIGGVDYRFTDYLILGLSFSYAYTDVDIKRSSGGITSNAYYGTLYGSAYWNSFYVDGLFSLGGANYDIDRSVSDALLSGSTDGLLYRLALAVGYDYFINSFSITPYGRLSYAQNNLGSYSERTKNGREGQELRIHSQDIKSFTTALGTQTAYAWSVSWGVIRPEILFEWIHEFEDDPDIVSANFTALQDAPMGVDNPRISGRPPSADSDYFNLGGGISAILPRGISVFVYYERTLWYENLNANYITGGVRKEF